ncbi:MAG: ArnT family glycosyltransferase [Gemmatimonadaceae bacterium]
MSSALRQPAVASPPRPHTVAQPRWRPRPRLYAYAAILIGAFVRAAHVLSAGFPLNDGGLFFRMTQELQAANYHLPAFTTYNNASIPFAYSPLGFYVAGGINSLTGIPLLDLFRFIPLVATILSVVAFYHLARTMLRDEQAAAAAVFAFALIPRSFVWNVMGGGVTRSLGLLFAIIALQQVYQLYTRREWRYAATSGVACALTVLTHLSTANFLAFSIVLFFAFYGRHRFGILSSAVVLVATVALTAPWWTAVVAAHGLAPFHAAGSVSGSIFGDKLARYDVLLRLAQFNTSIGGEAFFPLVSVVALIGAFASLRPGQIILPVWWVLITALDARGGMSYAPVATALLAGVGMAHVIIPGLRSLYRAPASLHRAQASLGPDAAVSHSLVRSNAVAPLLRFVPALVLVFLLLYGMAGALTRNSDYGGETASLTALIPADRHAMQWVAQHTPISSSFLVVSGKTWAVDKVSEWFPALANRTSISTIQGSEWLPGFPRKLVLNDVFQKRCRTADGGCLTRWSEALGSRPFTGVYVPKTGDEPCCTPLITALRNDPSYVTIYDAEGAFIAERR